MSDKKPIVTTYDEEVEIQLSHRDIDMLITGLDHLSKHYRSRIEIRSTTFPFNAAMYQRLLGRAVALKEKLNK